MARRPTAVVAMRRPLQPLTRSQLLELLAPLLEALNVDAEDLQQLTISQGHVRLVIVPRTKAGRRQLDSVLRVSCPVWPDADEGGDD
jgi:hypothetical protein